MNGIALRQAKPKITEKSVQGKIVVFAEDGARIGQWGGTECFLSMQSAIGPCLVVRSSKHKRHQGTFFRLASLQRVLAAHVQQGKLTAVVPHERRTCTIMIDTTTDINELCEMAALLTNRPAWSKMERNVASKNKSTRKRATDVEQGDSGGLRDAAIDALEPDAYGYDGDDLSDRESTGNALDMASETGMGAPVVALGHGGVHAYDDEVARPPAGASLQPSRLGASGPAGAAMMMSSSSPFDTDDSSAALASPFLRAWTAEQQQAEQLILAGHNVFITGAAGTGKTEWLLHMLHDVLRPRLGPQHPHLLAVTATTGIAARQIEGSTIYSFAGIGRAEGTQESLLRTVRARPDVVRAWKACAVLVLDEISVLPARVFTLLDYIARDIRGEPNKPFGGIQLLIVGDFLQLPPVSRGGEEVACAFMSPSWVSASLYSVQFSLSYRHDRDVLFGKFCDDVRRGEYTLAVDDVFQECLNRPLDEHNGVEATMVMAKRKDVEAYNEAKLNAIESPQFHRYASEDYAAIPGTDLDGEFSAPGVLTLKSSAQVILLSSLPDNSSLANGDLGVVVGFAEQTHGPALPIVRFASSGEEVLIPRVRMECTNQAGQVIMTRTQVPLQLAWALTVHRVQGMTLPMVRIRLDRSFFETGQAYVAISRVRRRQDLCLEVADPKAIKTVSASAVTFYDHLFPLTEAQQEEARARRAFEQKILAERLHERKRAKKRNKGTRKATKRERSEIHSEEEDEKEREDMNTNRDSTAHSPGSATGRTSGARTTEEMLGTGLDGQSISMLFGAAAAPTEESEGHEALADGLKRRGLVLRDSITRFTQEESEEWAVGPIDDSPAWAEQQNVPTSSSVATASTGHTASMLLDEE